MNNASFKSVRFKQERVTLGMAELLAQLGNEVKLPGCVCEEPASQRRDGNAMRGDGRRGFD
jgi:hypothetical protein